MREGCQECARYQFFKAMEELRAQVPMDIKGFGQHDSYIMGMNSAIIGAINGIIQEARLIEKEGMDE